MPGPHQPHTHATHCRNKVLGTQNQARDAGHKLQHTMLGTHSRHTMQVTYCETCYTGNTVGTHNRPVKLATQNYTRYPAQILRIMLGTQCRAHNTEQTVLVSRQEKKMLCIHTRHTH